jgi:hypothetical protein
LPKASRLGKLAATRRVQAAVVPVADLHAPFDAMANNYVWSFEPTFTQGLVIGQLSIIFLLILVLRHLFFDSRAGRRLDTPTYHPRLEREEALQASASEKIATSSPDGGESAEWFSLILQNVSNLCFSSSNET